MVPLALVVFFCRAILCISAAYAVMQCLSVRPSECLSRSYILSKRVNISSIFSPSGSRTILAFFRTKRHGNILTGTLLTGASNASGVGKNRDR